MRRRWRTSGVTTTQKELFLDLLLCQCVTCYTFYVLFYEHRFQKTDQLRSPRASKGKVHAFTTHPDLDTHHTWSYETETQTSLSCVPSTLVCPSPPPYEIPEINNPAIQLAGCLGSPSCRCAPHTALTVSRDRAGRGQAAPSSTWFSSQKGQVFPSKKVRLLRQWTVGASSIHTHTHNRVGTTEGLRVVIATGVWAAASEQELLAGPFKPTLLPPWISQWLASGVSGWIRTRRADRRTVILSCHSSTEQKLTAVSGHSHRPRHLSPRAVLLKHQTSVCFILLCPPFQDFIFCKCFKSISEFSVTAIRVLTGFNPAALSSSRMCCMETVQCILHTRHSLQYFLVHL